MNLAKLAVDSLILLVCIALAGFSVYGIFATNYNTEIRPKLIGAITLVIMVMVGAGMVMAIMSIPVGTYFNVVGLVTMALVAVLWKFARK
jgi:hypothetical protein